MPRQVKDPLSRKGISMAGRRPRRAWKRLVKRRLEKAWEGEGEALYGYL